MEVCTNVFCIFVHVVDGVCVPKNHPGPLNVVYGTRRSCAHFLNI